MISILAGIVLVQRITQWRAEIYRNTEWDWSDRNRAKTSTTITGRSCGTNAITDLGEMFRPSFIHSWMEPTGSNSERALEAEN